MTPAKKAPAKKATEKQQGAATTKAHAAAPEEAPTHSEAKISKATKAADAARYPTQIGVPPPLA